MTPRIHTLNYKKLIGIQLPMSFANYKPAELWKSFMPRRKEIINSLSNDLTAMTVYKSNHFTDFKPTNEFVKWATIEVTNFDNVPNEMETFTLPGGLYAVFDYKGTSSDHSIYEYIYLTWIPNSEYNLDDRPHFEILSDRYKPKDPTSEEEIWIPIKPKKSASHP